ncbi:hypothetical protein D3C78_1173720 [compost metagenome]
MHDALRGVGQVVVGQHHGRRLAAELQGHRRQVGGGGTHDDTADARRAGEDDVIERQRGEHAGVFQLAADQGYFVLAEHLGQQAPQDFVGARVELGHLEHHPVARGEGADQPGDADVDREVPRRDDPDHALGLVFHPQAVALEQQFGRARAGLHPAAQVPEGVVDVQYATQQVEKPGVDAGAVAEIGAHSLDDGVLVAAQLRAQRAQSGFAFGQRGIGFGAERLTLVGEQASHTQGRCFLNHASLPLVLTAQAVFARGKRMGGVARSK